MIISSQKLFRKLRPQDYLTIDLQTWTSYDSFILACFVYFFPLIAILAAMLASTVIFKWEQVKTEIYRPTGQVDFKVLLCPVMMS